MIDVEIMRLRFQCAFSYLETVNQLDGISAEMWEVRYADACARRSLPSALALINPLVTPLSREEWAKCIGSRSFSVVRPRITRCASRLIWGYDCPRLHATHQIDHFWPYSLGGRSAVENGLWLCEVHNRAKSDDVHFYAWEEEGFPSWLSITLSRIESHLG